MVLHLLQTAGRDIRVTDHCTVGEDKRDPCADEIGDDAGFGVRINQRAPVGEQLGGQAHLAEERLLDVGNHGASQGGGDQRGRDRKGHGAGDQDGDKRAGAKGHDVGAGSSSL